MPVLNLMGMRTNLNQNINIFTLLKTNFLQLRMSFPFVKQPDAMDCGPACLKMIAGFYKMSFSLDSLRKKCYITREGVSFLGLSEAADNLGFQHYWCKNPVGDAREKCSITVYCPLATETFRCCL